MSEWISVEDRLPDTESLCTNGLDYLVGYLGLNKVCESEGMIIEEVTHWMPLQPPESKDE